MKEILGYYNSEELKSLGLKQCGKNVLLSKNTRLYNPEKTTIGNNVRIDDFCVITGKIDIGNFVGISQRVSFYTNNEDYVSGKGISSASVPEKFQFTKGGTIILDDHALIGAHSVILPLTHLKKGTVVGALSLVNCICDEWTLYAGIPVKKIKKIPNEEKLEFEKDIQDEEI